MRTCWTYLLCLIGVLGWALATAAHPPASVRATDIGRPTITTTGALGKPLTVQKPSGLTAVEPAAFSAAQEWVAAFTDGFETGLNPPWTAGDASEDGFDRTWGVDPSYAHRGSRALWVAAGGTDALNPATSFFYPANLDSWLTLGTFDLRRAQRADLEFYMRSETEPQADYIFVGVSVDGVNYTGDYWTGDSGGWQSYHLDLSPYVGYDQVTVAWWFHSDGNDAGGYEGVWLDDVVLWIYTESGPPQASELVQNGDFETGDLTGWSAFPGSAVGVIGGDSPVGGTSLVALGGAPAAQEIFYQPLALPAADLAGATLSFWLNQYGEEARPGVDLFCAAFYTADLALRLLDLGCLDGVEATSSHFDPAGWQAVELTLTGEQRSLLQGQPVALAFELVSNESGLTTVLLDAVSLVVITGGEQGDAYEPNDEINTATMITPGATLTGLTIAPDADYDFFRVEAAAGETIIADVDAAIYGSPLDAVAFLLDAAGVPVCTAVDDGNTADPYLVCPVTEAGTYYVVIGAYDGHGDRNHVYNLTVTVADSNVPPEPTPIPTPQPTPDPQPRRAWTAILYLNGDNNLCRTYPGLIARMEAELGDKIGPDGFLHIAVLFDRNPRYCAGSGSTIRFLVQPAGAYTEGVTWWEMGERNLGDPETLVNFARWAMENYPADHYYLAIDNHGGGATGIAWDDTNRRDNLTPDELYSALKRITHNGERKIDLLAYEACLMGLYENAYDVRRFVDYLFFFPSVSFTNMASYPSYLGDGRFSATTTARELGDILFDVYFDAVRHPYVMSLVDSSQLDALHAAVNSWAIALRGEVGTNHPTLAAARAVAQKVDGNGDDRINDLDPYVDLWDLADKLAQAGLAQNEAGLLKAAIETAVVRVAIQPPSAHYTWDYANARGLTIYWPKTPGGVYARYVGSQLYSASRDGAWDDFLLAYFGKPARRGLEIDPSPVDRLPTIQPLYEVYFPYINR